MTRTCCLYRRSIPSGLRCGNNHRLRSSHPSPCVPDHWMWSSLRYQWLRKTFLKKYRKFLLKILWSGIQWLSAHLEWGAECHHIALQVPFANFQFPSVIILILIIILIILIITLFIIMIINTNRVNIITITLIIINKKITFVNFCTKRLYLSAVLWSPGKKLRTISTWKTNKYIHCKNKLENK